jgi:hypothetical protein
MTECSWSSLGGDDCLRVEGAAPDAALEVRAGRTAPPVPAMAGQVVIDGHDRCFVPRFPFVAGTAYTVYVDDAAVAVLERPPVGGDATTEVVAIHPAVAEVPRNLLRVAVAFSAPMAEGAAAHIRLVDELGSALTGVLLPTEYELWDASRRRLTLLLDPARIKRGLVAHRELGYPLRVGSVFQVDVGVAARDATGRPLRAPATRRYRVVDDERRRVEPDAWTLDVGDNGLVVRFSRPLDHQLVGGCLRVIGPDGRPAPGRGLVDDDDQGWTFVPADRWTPGAHALVVDPALEDLAGNSVRRVFDRELAHPDDERLADGPVVLTFEPG